MQTAHLINTVYQEIDGFIISANSMKTNPFYYIGMVYDEVSTESFLTILSLTHPQQGEIFYDLGGGIGKKVLAAAYAFPFAKSIGIELIKDLHIASERALKRYYQLVSYPSASVHFYCQDFNTFDFSDGDVFFLSLTKVAMEIELYGRLKSKLEKLKLGSRLITTDKPFLSSCFSYEEFDIADFGKRTKGKYFLHTKIE